MAIEWSSLPDEVWQLILRKVPRRARLRHCSTVCRKLYRAAAAATDKLQLNCDRRAQRSQGFRDWLQQHGRHLVDLDLEWLVGAVTALPCQRLRQLSLCLCTVQLGPSHGQPGILSGCPALTRLELSECQIADDPVGLAAFAAVPALQHLELLELSAPQHSPTDPGSSGPDDFEVDEVELAVDVLLPLTQLTSLTLGNGLHVTSTSLQHIGGLQQLQNLSLYFSRHSAQLSPSSTPGLMKLTALQSFILCCGRLDPAVLCSCTQLRRLTLSCVTILGALDATPLLSLIGRQQQLQELGLPHLKIMQPAAAAAYTALTASSKLQGLQLGPARGALPAGVWQAVFRPVQQLPDLEYCDIQSADDDRDVEDAVTPPFSTADVAALASCCPGLQRLALPVQPDAQLAALSQLTALTYISVRHATAASARSLGAVTRLKSVGITRESFGVDIAELLPLTSLQQLTHLSVMQLGRYVTTKYEAVLWLDNKSPPGDEPDVWRQLLEHCQKTAAAATAGGDEA